jgi:hypothetical protein
MIGAFKTFLLWLLIAALPLQGFAAVISSSCGPEQQWTAPTSGSDQADEATDILESHHHAGGMDSNAKAFSAESGSHASDHGHHHKTAFCGTCGTCCAGAFALTSAVSWPPAVVQSGAQVVAPAPLVTGFVPDGLERPPRPFSA